MSRAILANESLGRLAGGIAHDLNNVLAAIVGYANLLSYGRPNDDPMVADIRQILASAERGAKLTRQLLVWSRQQVLSPRAMSLARFVSERTEIWRRLLGVPLSVGLDDTEALGVVRLDPNELDLLLLGMVANVRSRNHDNQPVTLQLTPRVLDATEALQHNVPAGAYAEVVIKTESVGLPTDWRTNLASEIGAAYQVSRQMGGDLAFTMTANQSILLLLLPMVATTAAQEPMPAVRPSATVLLVDDEDVVRAPLARLLRSAHYTVIEAANAGEAILLVEEPAPPIDLLITDVAMPRVSGPLLAARLRREHPKLPVLFLTGHDPAGASRNELDADPWLLKPVNPSQLLEAVATALR